MTSAHIISLILAFFTLCLQRGFINLFKKNKKSSLTRFSVVIACKNEAKNLQKLFLTLDTIDYDSNNFEVIFVDDNSTDNSFEMLTKFCTKSAQYHAYRLNSTIIKGKKNALQQGIKNSLYEWIVLTDADCIIPDNWLLSINNHIQHNKKHTMFIGYSPEVYHNSFQYFKQLASAVIYASSAYAGIPVSCTGRNLVFEKKTFSEVRGYEGLFHLSSGDDKLLMHRFLNNNQKLSYIPYPPVFTYPVEKENLKNQNLRRYGKFSMSSLSWQMAMTIIGALLLYMPVELIIKKSINPLIVYIITIEVFFISGCLLHKEKIKPVYLLYSVLFPYYLAYQMIASFTKKWTWK